MSLAKKATVYLLEHDTGITDTIRGLCNEKAMQLKCFSSKHELLGAVEGQAPMCIVAANDQPDGQAIRLLEDLDGQYLQVPVIILGGHSDVSAAVAAIKAGAVDYIEKPIVYGRLAEHFSQISKGAVSAFC